MVHTILSALTPIVFVTALGWFAGSCGLLPDGAKSVLAAFVVTFALPVSLFLAAARAEPGDILNPAYILALAAGLLGVWAATLAAARLSGRPAGEGAMRGLTAAFPNMAYCGPPVLGAVVGSSGILAVVVGNLIVTLVMIPLSLVMMSRDEGAGAAIGGAVRQPLVVLPVLGLLVSLSGWDLPDIVHDAGDELGRAAGGCALFTLGLILAGIRPRIDREVVLNVALKNVVQPALMLGAGVLLGLSGDLLKTAFLLGVLPAATAAPTLALAHRTYAETAAQSVLASTLLSIPGIVIGIAIANHL